MTPIELTARREALGLLKSDLAALAGKSGASITRYEDGTQPIGNDIEATLLDLEEQVEAVVDLAAEMLDATPDRPVTLHVWATDEAFWKAHPQQTGLPAACYRVAMARARMLADDPNTTFLVGP